MNGDWSQQHVVVLGATGALGSLFARELRQRGAHVSLVVRDFSRVAADLAELKVAQADVRNRRELDSAVGELCPNGCDGIINATGVVAFGTLGDVPDDVVATLLAVNAGGTMNALSVAQRHVREGGFLVSLSGVAADMAVLGMSADCASKAAAKTAMQIGARELRSQKIAVLDARPGHTDTGLAGRALWGSAPNFAAALDPLTVVQRVLEGVRTREKDLPPEAFVTN